MMVCAVRFAADCFVNLSAFVLAGSHLVLSNTKAESILGTADIAATQGCYATFFNHEDTKAQRGTKEVASQLDCHWSTEAQKKNINFVFLRVFVVQFFILLLRRLLRNIFNHEDTKAQRGTKELLRNLGLATEALNHRRRI